MATKTPYDVITIGRVGIDIYPLQVGVGLEKVETDEPFLAKGIRYVADGYDLEFIRDNLERDRDNFITHLDEGQKIYRAIGDCAPAFGMIGTLIGMVQITAVLLVGQSVLMRWLICSCWV